MLPPKPVVRNTGSAAFTRGLTSSVRPFALLGAMRSLSAAAAAAIIATAAAGCGGSPGAGLAQGPSSQAVVFRFTEPPDSVITATWEVLRADGILARSFGRETGDTINAAYLESDWVYVPNVMRSAVFGSLREPEKWVKFLFWARPASGGTTLHMDALFNPTDRPTEPVNWSRLRPVPSVHPAWSYAERVIGGVERKLTTDEEERDDS